MASCDRYGKIAGNEQKTQNVSIECDVEQNQVMLLYTH